MRVKTLHFPTHGKKWGIGLPDSIDDKQIKVSRNSKIKRNGHTFTGDIYTINNELYVSITEDFVLFERGYSGTKQRRQLAVVHYHKEKIKRNIRGGKRFFEFPSFGVYTVDLSN